MGGYVGELLAVTLIAVILASSLNLMVGYARIYSLAHASMYGIGAYTGALIAIHYTPNVFVVCGSALLAGAIGGTILAGLAIRIRFEYFLVASIGFQIIMQDLFNNLGVTGGSGGLSVPALTLFGIQLTSSNESIAVLAIVTAIALGVAWMVRHSPWGRAIIAGGDDEVAASAFGMRTHDGRFSASAIAGALAGVAGAMYAYQMAYINSTTFALNESVVIMAMVIIGGAGTFVGPIIGAVIVTVIPELLGFFVVNPTDSGLLQTLLYGLILVIMMRFQPAGLAGFFRRSGPPRETPGIESDTATKQESAL